jgi:hypothetical protein
MHAGEDIADEEDDVLPPWPRRVAERALVLATVCCRSLIEVECVGEVEAGGLLRKCVQWFDALGIGDELEPAEVRLIHAPLGSLTSRESIDGCWRAEGLAVLAWALGRCEVPPYDEVVDVPTLAADVGWQRSPTDTVLHEPVLRPVEEIEKLGQNLLALHWRLRQFSLKREAIDFVAFARDVSWAVFSLEGVRLGDRDLEIGGKALAACSENEWRTVSSIVSERDRAVRWLLGDATLYSEVSCDT